MKNPKKAQILIVDDHPTNIKVLSDLLTDYGFEVLIAKDGENALQKLRHVSPDLILLDVLMPGIDGFETCRRLKADAATQDIPVIFMTALTDAVDKIKGLTLGAVDYVTKPLQHEEVIARVNVHLKLRSLTRQLEEQNALLQEEVRSRQLAEAALRLSEDKFSKAFRLNPGPMMLTTLEDGRFLEVNQNFCSILGYVLEEVHGRTMTDLNLWVQAAERDRFERELRTTGMMDKQECLFHTKAGDIKIILLSAGVLQLGHTTCVLAVTQDITACKQAAADLIASEQKYRTLVETQARLLAQIQQQAGELQQAKDAADAANKAKSEFLASISHELRTPLNAILGFTQLMSRDTSLQQEQQENLSIINRSGEHLLTLINDVLEMSKIEVGKTMLNLTSFDLYHLLDSLQELLELKAREKGLHLRFDRTPTLPQYIQTDEIKLRQVLLNLLGNSLKFTQQGSVTLRVREGTEAVPPEAAPPEAEITAIDPAAIRFLHFEVEDTGPGIAPEELDGLFEAFSQTEVGRRSQQGTGLGLPISRKFIHLMGGDIGVSSMPGQGCVFKFKIRIHPADRSQIQPLRPQRRVIGLEPGHPTYRIVVAEDDWSSRQLLVKLLRPLGFEVREAVNGRETIALCQSWSPHLIWMDLQMSEMNGYEATKAIKAGAGKQAPIIIALTASVFEEERLVALAAGFDDFVRKPFQEATLLDKMVEHLGVRYRYGEAVDLATPTISHSQAVPSSTGKTVRLRILLAEDNPVNQKLTVRVLQRLGYTAEVVASGEEVLQALHQQAYDVILMDVRMPGLGGLETARQICQTYASGDRPRIIAMTANASERDRADCLESGMDDYLCKPFRLEDLQRVLSDCRPRA